MMELIEKSYLTPPENEAMPVLKCFFCKEDIFECEEYYLLNVFYCCKECLDTHFKSLQQKLQTMKQSKQVSNVMIQECNTRCSDNIVVILLPFSLNVCSKLLNFQSIVFKLTTILSLSKNSLLKNFTTLFENALQSHNIHHKLINLFAPCYNGKVEHYHHKDNDYFHATHTFFSFDDFSCQLKAYKFKYNIFPMRPLHWKSTLDYLRTFLLYGKVF